MNNVASVTPAVRTSADDGLGIPDFCRRSPGEKPPVVVLRSIPKIPYAGKESPEETAALKNPPVNVSAVKQFASAKAMRKALKASSAPKVEAIAKPAKVAKPEPKPKAAKVAPKAKAAKPAANGKTKLELITALLLRKSGCTNADVLEVTNWPSVSMPQQATAAGIKLRKEKKPGAPTRYYGSK